MTSAGAGRDAEGDAGGRAELSIGDLADASGVPVETIRIWERRYGRPESIRLPSGHRRYRGDLVPWLRAVAAAVATGMRASSAVRATPEALRLAAGGVPGEDGDGAARSQVADLVRLASEMRGPELRRRLRRQSREMPLLAFLEERIAPFLAAIGRAWADGRAAVRHEHLAAEIVGDLLRDLRARHRPRRSAPRIALSTLPGDRHDLGVRMAAAVAASLGFQCVVLGADTPLEDIVAAAAESRACAVAVSISLPRGGVEADRMVRRLRESLPAKVRVLAGGAGARSPRRVPRGVDILGSLHELHTLLGEIRPAPSRGREPS